MRLWRAFIVALVGLGQVGCATHLADLGKADGEYHVFREKSGLYEIRIPENRFKSWRWQLPAAATDVDLVLYRKRHPRGKAFARDPRPSEDNEAEIGIMYPRQVREDLTPILAAGDLMAIAREFLYHFYARKNKKWTLIRVGDRPITPQTRPEEILAMEDLFVEKTIGVHSILEIAPHISEQRRRIWLQSTSRLRGTIIAFRRVNDRLMILALESDMELLEENRQAFYEVIRNIQFLAPNG